MSLFIKTFQFLKTQMGVDFGCGQLSVPQQLLNSAKLGIVVEHSRSTGVTEYVRALLLDRSKFTKTAIDHPIYVAVRNAPSPTGKEQRAT